MSAVYSRDQLSQFLSYIEVPAKYQIDRNPRLDINFLTVLHIHMITAIPYENLTLHYSSHRRVTIDPQEVFRKIVQDNRGRGGYCMELELLFLNILRAIGFQVYPVGAKIRYRTPDGVPQGNYIGWMHLVNIVTLPDSTQWMVDVSFGGDGATQPLPLIDGAMIRNLGTQDVRLVRDFIPGQTELTPDHKMWIYQYRNGPDKPWNSYYAFSPAVEWLPEDFGILNWYAGSSPESFQTFTVLVVRFLRRANPEAVSGEQIYGKRMLGNGVVKENLGGRTKVVKECLSETERIEALKEWFGIELTEEEKAGIAGHVTELKA